MGRKVEKVEHLIIGKEYRQTGYVDYEENPIAKILAISDMIKHKHRGNTGENNISFSDGCWEHIEPETLKELIE